jgi:hypothetical protein
MQAPVPTPLVLEPVAEVEPEVAVVAEVAPVVAVPMVVPVEAEAAPEVDPELEVEPEVLVAVAVEVEVEVEVEVLVAVVVEVDVEAAPVAPTLFPHPTANRVTTLQAPARMATLLPAIPPTRNAPIVVLILQLTDAQAV